MSPAESATSVATLELLAPARAPQPGPAPVRPRRLVFLWAALGLLLLGEILFLTIRHDSGALTHSSAPLGRVVSTAPDFLRILITGALIALALTAWRLRGRFREAVDELGLSTGLWPWLPVHLAAFAALELTSRKVFGPQPNGGPYLAWCACVIATALSWLAAAIRPRSWPPLFRRGGWVILASLVLGICGWGVSQFARAGWDAAAAPTFWAARQVLGLVSTDVVSDQDTCVLGTAEFRVRIAPECSGYEGVGLVCLYLGLYLILFRRHLRFPQSLVLIPIGAVAAWSLNVVRIAALIVIGDRVSPELALGGFHSQAGWLAFNAVALCLVFLAHRSQVFSAVASVGGPNPTAAYLAPFLTIVAVQMMTEAFFNGSPLLYSVRVAAAAACLAFCWRTIVGFAGHDVPNGERSIWGAVLPILGGISVFAIWVELWILFPSDRGERDPREGLIGLPNWALAIWLILRVAGSVAIVPLIEEIAFRGYLLRRLVSADFQLVGPRQLTWPALLISSALFGLLHPHWLAGMLAGLIYAAVYCRRGRLSDTVLAHATTNALITLVALTTGQWQFWS
jgi:exosortase E/protease (VPEID-CTERM system)